MCTSNRTRIWFILDNKIRELNDDNGKVSVELGGGDYSVINRDRRYYRVSNNDLKLNEGRSLHSLAKHFFPYFQEGSNKLHRYSVWSLVSAFSEHD